MSLKIHTFPNNPRANKALVAAEYAGVKVEVVNVELGKDNKTEQFLAMNPLGKVPTLETADGSIWESNAIARYVARQGDSKLFGSNDLEAGQVDQWIDWVRGDLELAGAVWLYPLYGLIPNNPQATEQAKEDIKKQLVMLDNHIATRSYLVGERISLADIVVACTLIPLYTNVFDVSYRETFPNVNRWFDNVVNQPNFKKVQGEVILATEMKVAPAWVPKEEEEKGNEDAAVDAAPAKKVKNPLSLLPESSMSLDEWKRVYSNTDVSRDACKWLWENWDPEGYSAYICHYKHQDELNKTFMSLNLMSGFLQRLDSLRKYGMGSLVLLGADDKSEIHGAFIVRGKDLPEEVTGSPDYPVFQFNKIDPSNEQERKYFDDLMCWEGDFNGNELKFNEGKTFK